MKRPNYLLLTIKNYWGYVTGYIILHNTTCGNKLNALTQNNEK